MDEILTQPDIDHALESTAGVVIDIDTVAIWNEIVKMYGVYRRANEYRWDLFMTTFRLESIMQ